MALNFSKASREAEEKRDFVENCAAFDTSLSKLESVLREENGVLEAHQSIDHGPFTVRKNHILRELMVLHKGDKTGAVVASMTNRLKDIRQLVDFNHRLLRAQIEAMSEITNVLTRAAIADGEDGTYSRKM